MRTTKAAAEPRFAWAVSAALFLAVCAYIGAGLFAWPTPEVSAPETVPASAGDGLPLQGIAVRREQLVCSPGAEVLAEEGRRIPAGGLVARGEEETLSAPASALFFSDWDGLESLRPEGLEAWTARDLRELLAEEPDTDADALGRLVLGYDWYFAALAAEDAVLPEPGRCRLRFEGLARPLEAELLSVSPPEEGGRVLLFRLTAGDAESLALRKAAAWLLS